MIPAAEPATARLTEEVAAGLSNFSWRTARGARQYRLVQCRLPTTECSGFNRLAPPRFHIGDPLRSLQHFPVRYFEGEGLQRDPDRLVTIGGSGEHPSR